MLLEKIKIMLLFFCSFDVHASPLILFLFIFYQFSHVTTSKTGSRGFPLSITYPQIRVFPSCPQ